MASGIVHLVGAGPGEGSLTLRGVEVLGAADAIVYADRRLGRVARRHGARSARKVHVGRSRDRDAAPAEDVRHLLVTLARDGRRVVYLAVEDPFGDADVGEMAQALHDASVAFEVVPGVSASGVTAAWAGVPLLTPTLASAAVLVDGRRASAADGESIDWAAIARVHGTLVVRNARRVLRDVRDGYARAGLPSEIPVALLVHAGTMRGRVVTGSLGRVDELLPSVGRGAVTLVVGWSVLLRDELAWRERRPLDGRRIAFVRARHASPGIATRLRELGARVIAAPELGVASLDLEPLREAINSLADVEWIVFSSPDAVAIFWEQLLASGRDARALGAARVACIAPATAAALLDRGITVDVVQEKFGADALLDLFAERPDVPGAPMLYVADDASADPFARDLEGAGAIATPLAVYREIPPRRSAPAFRAVMEAHAPELTVATSASAVEAYVRMVGEEVARSVPLAVTDANAAAVARSLGIDVVVEAAGEGIDEFVQAIVSTLTSRGDTRPRVQDVIALSHDAGGLDEGELDEGELDEGERDEGDDADETDDDDALDADES